MSRPTHAARSGFTLVEVMIVVVVMAILAGAVLPQFTDTTKVTKTNNAKYNVQKLRSQLQLYKLQHGGQVPARLENLTQRTDASGTVGTGAAFIYGPYMQAIPENGFTSSAKVSPANANPPTAASGAADAGWLYHAASGGVWIDDAELLAE